QSEKSLRESIMAKSQYQPQIKKVNFVFYFITSRHFILIQHIR
ncbi:MAG: hypothetical protein RL059_1409, partial [Bacteroidota bacterium]